MEAKYHVSENEWVNNEIKEENKSYLEKKENENITPNLWDTGKSVLKGTFIAFQAYFKKQENVK